MRTSWLPSRLQCPFDRRIRLVFFFFFITLRILRSIQDLTSNNHEKLFSHNELHWSQSHKFCLRFVVSVCNSACFSFVLRGTRVTGHFVLTYHLNVHDCFNMYFFCVSVFCMYFCVSTNVDYCLSAQYDVRKYLQKDKNKKHLISIHAK